MLNLKNQQPLTQKTLLCFSFFNLLTVPVMADAQIKVADIEEIIVTASKRQQSVHDFSGSVTIIKGDTLNPSATISDIANQTPGLTAINNGPRNTAALIIRGLRTDQMGSSDFAGDGGSVATYVDNIPLQGFFVPPAIDIKDMQQIEILRGPQGTLYGNASIGGLIRYVTEKPDLTHNTAAIHTAVSHTEESKSLNYDSDLVVNTPLIDNTLAIRLLFSKQYNAGFIDNEYLLTGKQQDINADTTNHLRATVLWKPVDEFSLTSSYSYQKINAEDRQASNKGVTGNAFTASSKYLQPKQGDLRLSSVDADYSLGWATITASVNRYDYTTHATADQTDFLLHTYGEGYYAEYSDFSAFTQGNVSIVKNSSELRLASPNDQAVRWLLGVFLSDDDLDVTIADRVPGFAAVFNEKRPDGLDYLSTQAEKLAEQSFYGELAYDIQPNVEVVVGARHFAYKDRLNTCSLVFPAKTEYEGDHYPLACLAGNDEQSGTLGRFKLGKFSTKYKFTAVQNIYFTVAEGFRRGGVNFLPVEITHNRSYQPDSVVNYELGTHSDFLKGDLQLNASVFYMDWEKVQVSTRLEGGNGAVVNAGSAHTKGTELDLTTQLNAAWRLNLSYTLTDATLSETVNIVSNENNDLTANKDDRLTGSPKQQWSLGLQYQQAIGIGQLSSSIHYAYASNIHTSLNKTFADYAELSGYGMLNAQAELSLQTWQLGVFVNNMSNSYAITGRRTTTFYGEVGQFDYITRPRTLGISAKHQF